MTTGDRKKEIIDAYIELVKINKRVPSLSQLHSKGITRDTIRHHFSNITTLHAVIQQEYSEKIERYIINENTLFTKKKLATLKGEIENYSKFFITTAVSGKAVNEKFLNTIRHYCEQNNAKLLILPCMDVVSRDKTHRWNFDSAISKETFVFDDVKLNDNIYLNSIKLSAKHINPLTGLSRIGQRNGTFVYASPKQFLEFVATTSSKNRIPHALMTTGAITIPDYSTEKYMSERTSYIAENDHVLGGIVVEIENDEVFHFRQIQCQDNGTFIDLAKQYNPDGTVESIIPDIVLGDYHSGSTDDAVKEAIADMCKTLKVSDIILHDFFDGYCINHHDLPFPSRVARKSMNNKISLEQEIQEGGEEINFLHSICSNNLVMVKGNHDEFLERYLEKGTYVEDPMNHYISLTLAKVLLDGYDPLRYAYENYSNVKDHSRIIWLSRDEEYKVGNVELAAHGDLGANGSRSSLITLEKAYGNCIVGHTHSAAIFRGVFRVGTSTRMKLDYNKGPSSWTNTMCLIYPNGSRQLINVIYGKWRAE